MKEFCSWSNCVERLSLSARTGVMQNKWKHVCLCRRHQQMLTVCLERASFPVNKMLSPRAHTEFVTFKLIMQMRSWQKASENFLLCFYEKCSFSRMEKQFCWKSILRKVECYFLIKRSLSAECSYLMNFATFALAPSIREMLINN